MLDNSVHFSVAGSQSSAENTAWVSSLKPVPLVPPVISTLPSGSTVPVTCRRGWFIDAVKRHAGEAALISITSAVQEPPRRLPWAMVIAVGYQRPAAIGGAVLHVDVAGSNTLTSGRPYSSVMCPPGTITWPFGRTAFPEQNSHDGAFTVENEF